MVIDDGERWVRSLERGTMVDDGRRTGWGGRKK